MNKYQYNLLCKLISDREIARDLTNRNKPEIERKLEKAKELQKEVLEQCNWVIL